MGEAWRCCGSGGGAEFDPAATLPGVPEFWDFPERADGISSRFAEAAG
jgi:hypothetical protein